MYHINCHIHDFHIVILLHYLYFRFIMSSPLAITMIQNKLIGNNYVEWKLELDELLTANGCKYVLTIPCPPIPYHDTPTDLADQYWQWIRFDGIARSSILDSLSDVLKQQHQPLNTARAIILNLEEMFGDLSRTARLRALELVMDTRMLEGTSIREHVFKMITYFKVMEVLGSDIDGETQVDIILHSLPSSFTQFKKVFKMSKTVFSTSELMSSLEATMDIVKEESNVQNIGMASSSGTKPEGISLEKEKQDSRIGEPKPTVGKKARLGKGKAGAVPKGKCFHCGMRGHWKRNCVEYLTAKRQGTILSLVFEVS